MKYYAYTRVSTSRQEQTTSLAAQKQLITDYAERNNLYICHWFHEVGSAAKTDRSQFKKLVNQLNKDQADGLIIHAIDRSARNLRDWATLGDLVDAGKDVHFVQENINLAGRTSRLSADIQAVIAADYVRNLREETQKGINYRLQQGLYPFPAPLGYINNGSGKIKTIDPLRAPFIAEGFQLYATGEMSLSALSKHMSKQGLYNTKMRKVSKNAWSKVLRNSFYAGTIQAAGKTYPGIHEPLISRKLFDKVQEVLERKAVRKKQTHSFLFQRLLTCKYCGYSLIGEKQKGHIYYRCHSSGHTVSIREDRLLDLIATRFRQLANDKQWEQRIEKLVSSMVNIKPKKRLVSAQQLSMYNLNQQKGRLYELYAQNLINKKELAHKKDALTSQINTTIEQQRLARKQVNNMSDTKDDLSLFLTGQQDNGLTMSFKRDAMRKSGINILVSDTGVEIPDLLGS